MNDSKQAFDARVLLIEELASKAVAAACTDFDRSRAARQYRGIIARMIARRDQQEAAARSLSIRQQVKNLFVL